MSRLFLKIHALLFLLMDLRIIYNQPGVERD